MADSVTFHFEGGLADSHKMNFYESARFQYAAARLMVKLAQFRRSGKFSQNITAKSNFDIRLISQADGSFNINVEDPGQGLAEDDFIRISIADLIAYVSERIIEKIADISINDSASAQESLPTDGGSAGQGIVQTVDAVLADDTLIAGLAPSVRDLVKRRVAEIHRESRLQHSTSAVAKIDFARSQKLIAMSAPLLSEMATALRSSANTLEVRASSHGGKRPVLFLDQMMASEIETAIVDQEVTPILGDISQFNKDNGWGKLKIENGLKTVSFSIPSDILPSIKQTLIDKMKIDLVYLQSYFVRDNTGEVIRLIVVGVLPNPAL